MMMGGYFTMPSARMNNAGTTALGFSYLPPYRNYAATIQFFNRLEFGINYRVFINMPDPAFGEMGFGDFADRGANIKFKILSKMDNILYFPEIAIGLEDFYGSKRFYGLYIVATKEWLDYNLEMTVGYGKKRIKGFFGGMSYTPFRQTTIPILNQLSLLAEWDAIDYKHHQEEHPEGKTSTLPLNLGISTTCFNYLQLNLHTIRGERLAASASLHYPLGDSKGFLPKIHNPPLYTAPINTQPIGCLRNERELSQELAYAFLQQGITLHRIYLTTGSDGKSMLWIKVINTMYRKERDLKQHIKHILTSIAPSNISTITIVLEASGIPTHEYRFRVADLKQLREGTIDHYLFQTLTPMHNATKPPNMYEGTLLYHQAKKGWTLTFSPRLLTLFGSITGKFKYSIGETMGVEGYLFDQLYYNVRCSYTFKSNLSNVGDRDFLNPSQILNVRSDAMRYFQTHDFSLEQAYIQHSFPIKRGWYGRVAMGYFEPAYGGIAAELLYYPVPQNWAIGVTAAGVLKRHYHGIGFTTSIRKFKGHIPEYTHFIGYQYFLNLYYDLKKLNLNFKASIGQFLARDVGARFEIGHTFPSGLQINVWYTWTTARDIVNGVRHHDKGISLVIPLDLFGLKSNKSFFSYSLAVWLRDTGACATTGESLYPIIHSERTSPPRFEK